MKSMTRFYCIILLFLLAKLTAMSQDSNSGEITINHDGILLKGKFYISEGTGVFPTVILLQGFPGNEMDVMGIGKILSRSGINAITFNYSGTFKSEGKSSLKNSEMDILAKYKFLHENANILSFKIDTSNIILGGWSYGGGMATVDQYILPLYRALKKEKSQNVAIIAFQDSHFFNKSRPEVAQSIIRWIKSSSERKKL